MRRLLFKLARSPIASFFIGFAFAKLTKLMPLNRLYEDADCILFLHPKPYWQTHWLGVPKRAIVSFNAIDWTCDEKSVVAIVRQLIMAANSLKGHKAIVVNGGAYQDVPQLHFHLAHGGLSDGGAQDMVRFVEDGRGEIQFVREGHWQIVQPDCSPIETLEWDSSAETHLVHLLTTAQQFITQQQFSAYTLQFHWGIEPVTSFLIAHLFAE